PSALLRRRGTRSLPLKSGGGDGPRRWWSGHCPLLDPSPSSAKREPRLAARGALLSSCQLPPLLQGGAAAPPRGHQEGVALAEDALDIGRVHVGMADMDLVLLAGLDDVGHGVEHLGVLVLAGVAELLGKVALADQHEADAGHLLQDVG